MHTIQWHIRAENTPEIRRHCKKCGMERPFVSSGLFRVNANHHVLDIWLIHRCSVCSRSWNMEIYERVRPFDLSPEALHGFQINDAALAWQCAHDPALLLKNRVVADYTNVPILVDGPKVDLNALDAPLVITLVSDIALPIRLSCILREKLLLSSSALKRLAENGGIEYPGADVRKARFVPGMRIILRNPHRRA